MVSKLNNSIASLHLPVASQWWHSEKRQKNLSTKRYSPLNTSNTFYRWQRQIKKGCKWRGRLGREFCWEPAQKVCVREGWEGKIENESCDQQVDLLQDLLYSKEDHRKFPEGRGSKILEGNYSCFKWIELRQAYTNYILKSEEEAMREEIGKTLARVLKSCQGWQWPQRKGQMANSTPDAKKLVGATWPQSWLLLWETFWDNQQGFSSIFISDA